MSDINLIDQCVIRVQIYDRIEFIKFAKKDVLNWDIFIRTGEHIFIKEDIALNSIICNGSNENFSAGFVSNKS